MDASCHAPKRLSAALPANSKPSTRPLACAPDGRTQQSSRFACGLGKAPSKGGSCRARGRTPPAIPILSIPVPHSVHCPDRQAFPVRTIGQEVGMLAEAEGPSALARLQGPSIEEKAILAAGQFWWHLGGGQGCWHLQPGEQHFCRLWLHQRRYQRRPRRLTEVTTCHYRCRCGRGTPARGAGIWGLGVQSHCCRLHTCRGWHG